MIDIEYLSVLHSNIIDLVSKYEDTVESNPLSEGNKDLLKPIRAKLLEYSSMTVDSISELHLTLETLQDLIRILRLDIHNTPKLENLREVLEGQ